MKIKKIISVICAASMLFSLNPFAVIDAAAEETVPTVTIDAAAEKQEILHGATGWLYGMSNEGVPSNSTLTALKPKVLSTKGALGTEHPYGDALDVADAFFESGGEIVMMYNNGYYGKFGVDAEATDYAAVLTDKICPAVVEYKDKMREKYPDIDNMLVYVPINEGQPRVIDGTRQDTIMECWKIFYDAIKAADPGAVVCGPNGATYWSGYCNMEEFLTYCKENECLPDMVTWHQLGGNSLKQMVGNVENYRTICANLGIEEKKIVVNEYGWYTDCGVAANLLKYIIRFEETQTYGCMPFWHQANNLNDLTVGQNEVSSAWWLFKWYAQMEGKSIEFTSSNTDSTKGLQTLASMEDDRLCALVGGDEGNGRIVINNLGSTELFADSENVKVEIRTLDYEGINGTVTEPEISAEGVYTVDNGTVTIDLPYAESSTVFYVNIKPTEETASAVYNGAYRAMYEAEDADYSTALTIEASGSTAPYYFYSGVGRLGSFANDTDLLQYVIDVPADGRYKLSFIYSNGTGSKSGDMTGHDPKNLSQNVIIDGGEAKTLMLPNTLSRNSSDRADLYVNLTAGKHTVKLMNDNKEDEYYPGENVVPEIYHDCMYISLENDTDGFNEIYRAEDADKNADGALRWAVYAPECGLYNVTFDKNGSVDIYRNNTALTLDNFVATGNGVGMYLEKGVNIIDVEGDVSYMRVAKSDTAEDITVMATDGEGSFETAHSYYSDTDYVKSIPAEADEAAREENKTYLEIKVNVPESGKYAMQVYTSNNDLGGLHDISYKIIDRYASVSVNGGEGERHFFINTYSDDSFGEKTILVELNAGENTIRFYNDDSWNQFYCLNGNEYKNQPADIPLENYMPNFERFVFTPVTAELTADTYSVNIMTTDGGYVTSDKSVVEENGSVTLRVMPDASSESVLKELLINGEAVSVTDGIYTVTDVTGDINVKAEFSYTEKELSGINPEDYMELNGRSYGRTETDSESDNPPANAFDGNVSSSYKGGDGSYVGMNFAGAAFIKGIKVVLPDGKADMLNGAVLKASKDGTAWTTIYSFGDYVVTYPSVNTITVDDMADSDTILSESYSYLQLDLVNGADIAEITVYGRYDCEPQQIDLTDKEVTGTDGSSDTTGAAAAFDGDTETYDDAARRGYCQVDLGESTPLMRIGYYPRKGYAFRMNGGYFYGSNDNESWTALCAELSDTQEDMWHYVDVEGSWRYVRYSNAVRNIDIAEIAVFKVIDEILNYEAPSAEISFTTTPYAKITVNGAAYYSGKDGNVTAQVPASGADTSSYSIKYTIEKGGYRTVKKSTVAPAEGMSIECELVRESGILYSEDFDTVTDTTLSGSLAGGDTLSDIFGVYAKYGTLNITVGNGRFSMANAGGGFRNMSYPLDIAETDAKTEISVIFPTSGDANVVLRDSSNKVIGAVYRDGDGNVTFGASGTWDKSNGSCGEQSESLGTAASGVPVLITIEQNPDDNTVTAVMGDITKSITANTSSAPATIFLGTARGTTIALDSVTVKSDSYVAPEVVSGIGDIAYENNIVTVPVNIADGESLDVNIYIAEYNESGRLVSAKRIYEEVSENKDITSIFAKSDADNMVSVFVWDNEMTPYCGGYRE